MFTPCELLIKSMAWEIESGKPPPAAVHDFDSLFQLLNIRSMGYTIDGKTGEWIHDNGDARVKRG